MLFEARQQVVFVEDDDALRTATTQTMELAGLAVRAFTSADAAIAAIDSDFAGVIVSDIRMRGMDGLQLFAAVRALDPDIPVILITGHADVAMAVGALRDGAFDFLTKPFAADHLVAATRRALEKRLLVIDNRRLRAIAEAQEEMGPLVGDSPAIAQLRATIRQLAALDIDILIEGETGTGKDLVARMLHRFSRRRERQLATVNCSALPAPLAELDLFGPGPDQRSQSRLARPGQVENADRGTLLLGDVDCLPLPLQSRLLGVLEGLPVHPSGSPTARSLDLRVIATSRVDLGALVRDGRVRADLLDRLNAVTLRLPPLRERREDIPALFAVFVAEARVQLGARDFRLSEATRRYLTSHDWPGNVRELRNFAMKSVLGLRDAPATVPDADQLPLHERIRRFEAMVIEEALKAADGNVTAAQAMLMVPRKTLYEKMARLSLDPARFRRKRDG